MLLCILLESYAVLGDRPGLVLPFLSPGEVADPTLLYDPARFGGNEIDEELGLEVGVEGEGVDGDRDRDGDGRIRVWGV